MSPSPGCVVALIAACLLSAVGCLRSRRSGSDASEGPQDAPRAEILDGAAFCALGRRADQVPVDLELELPTGPTGQHKALTARIEAIEARANGEITSSWRLDRRCAVDSSELMFTGEARGRARLTIDVDNDVNIKALEWSTGWTNVILPVAPIPVSVSYRLGVRVDGEIRAQDPIRLIVEGRGLVAGKLGIKQAGAEVRLDPPETFDVTIEPRVEASADFAMDLHPVPWIDVRMYGIAGGRLEMPTDIALACTGMADPSVRRCRIDYRVAPTVQPLIGSTAVNVMIWEGPVLPVPLPAALRAGTIDVPVTGLDRAIRDGAPGR